MSKILERLNRRFQALAEQHEGNASWKDPNSPHYDRQMAENALFHTIGPLTDSPQWVESNWSSPGAPVPGFRPGGPAPQWTDYEVVMAFAGDPSMLFTGRDNPKSPMYGNKGGSPLYRLARRVARYYSRDNDRAFIEDLYGNGMVALTQIMQPGYDKSQSPFISFAMRTIQSAMEHGIGGSKRTGYAAGEESKETGLRGMKGLLKETDPAAVRQAAEVVKGKYQEQRSHDKHPDNPFGPFSSAYYQTAMAYADALESEDTDRIEAAQSRMRQLIDEIEDFEIPIRGASSGLGQAISTPDRKTSIGVQSMDVNAGNEEGSSMAGNIPTDDSTDSWLDPETIKYVLDIAINYDLGKLLASSEKYQQMAVDFGASVDKKTGRVKIGGPMTAQELRFTIRRLGPLGSNYPGRGTPRKNTDVPRDGKGWWQPGDDPEIEPIENGLWHSIWSRNGFDAMGPTEIGQEMAAEVLEFDKLGIESARAERVLGGKAAVSKVAVSNTAKSGIAKLRLIAEIHRHELGMEESVVVKHLPIMEGVNSIDRMIIAETCDWIVSRLSGLLMEVSPPGWKGTVKAMKKHKEIDNPWALAWSMKNKGAKPHYRDDESGEKKAEYANESRMKPVGALLENIEYRGFLITPTDPKPPIPDRSHDWTWVHPDYDGPEDRRIGTAASPDACRAEIDEFLAERQATREPQIIQVANEEEALNQAYLKVEDPDLHFVVSNDQGGYDVFESDGVNEDVLLFRFVPKAPHGA